MTHGKRLTQEEKFQRAKEKKIKDKIYFKEYYEKNKEKILGKNRRRAKENKEKMRIYQRKNYHMKTGKLPKEKMTWLAKKERKLKLQREAQKRYREKHKEKVAMYQEWYRMTYKDMVARCKKNRFEKNKEKVNKLRRIKKYEKMIKEWNISKWEELLQIERIKNLYKKLNKADREKILNIISWMANDTQS